MGKEDETVYFNTGSVHRLDREYHRTLEDSFCEKIKYDSPFRVRTDDFVREKCIKDPIVKKYKKKSTIVKAYQTDKRIVVNSGGKEVVAEPGDFVVDDPVIGQQLYKPGVFYRLHEEV